MRNYPKLITVRPDKGYTLILEFESGEIKLYHFAKNLEHPYYEQLRDETLFRSVTVEDGEILWKSGQDFCPHTLYDNSVPISAEPNE